MKIDSIKRYMALRESLVSEKQRLEARLKAVVSFAALPIPRSGW